MPRRVCPVNTIAAPHQELLAAKGNIAVALDKLRAIQGEALRLRPLVASGEIPRREAVEALNERAAIHGVNRTCPPGELDRIIADGLDGRTTPPPALRPPADNTANRDRQPPTARSWRPLTRSSPPPDPAIPPWHPPADRDALGRLRPGQSGNPNGRLPASRRRRSQPPTGSMQAVSSPALTAAELTEIASRAYGQGWQTALAADLGMSRASINRWARRRFRIPDDRTLEIGSLCAARAQENLAATNKGYRRIVRQLIRLQRLKKRPETVTVSVGKERPSRS
jgi:hypothetical protein